MPTTINVQCEVSQYPLQFNRLKQLSNWLLKESGLEDHNVGIALVDDNNIQEINHQYRHRDSPTNVLSFPFKDGADPALDDLPVKEMGDIIISLETAAKEAKQYGQTFQKRLSWLVIHGMLHLQGYDHERSKEDEVIMFSKEQELLDKLNNKRGKSMTNLAINVDHIATIRQARGISEPDPVAASSNLRTGRCRWHCCSPPGRSKTHSGQRHLSLERDHQDQDES